MKTKDLSLIFYAVLGLSAIGALGVFVDSASGPHQALSKLSAAEHVDVAALAADLEFLGAKPSLTGHPVLVEFWATWCPPCRASIAHLNELQQKYHAKGLEIVGISDEDKATVESFRSHTTMNYSVALDRNQKLAAKFEVNAIPHALLLDQDGRVVWVGHPMALEEDAITKLLPAHAAL